MMISMIPTHRPLLLGAALLLSGPSLALAQPAAKDVSTAAAAALTERGVELTRDPNGVVVAARFDRPLMENDIENLAHLPDLTRLTLRGPEKEENLAALKSLAKLKSLQVDTALGPDAGLSAVAGLTNLESLAWIGGVVSDEGLVELQPLTNLRELFLFHGRGITDDGLQHLPALTQLETLRIMRSRVAGSGFSHLQKLPQLESLMLTGAPVTNDGMEGLAGLKSLRELQLDGCPQVGDDGLAHIAKLGNLRMLKLDSTAVTNAGLHHLAGLDKLEFLTLAKTKVTDRGLEHLAKLDNLQRLFLFNTSVTPAGVTKLKQFLPRLTEVAGVDLTPKAATTPRPAQSPIEKGPGAPRNSEGKRRWAIVSTDAKLAGIADLLTATLADKPDLELVERQQIGAVLAEQELQASGLVAPDQTTRLGRLLKADALLLLTELPQRGSPAIRLRLVEVDTAVLLLDVVLPTAAIEKQLAAIGAQLEQAGAKLAVPEKERCYLGIMAIKSEEPGTSLSSTCQTLSALVSAGLHQRPRWIVLEREQLPRLLQEGNLAGTEQRLGGTAWLLEAGVQRQGESGFRVTCRLRAPSREIPETFQVEVESGDVVEIRNQIVDKIELAVGQERSAITRADLAEEAAIFATRRDWLRSANQLEQCAEMAEAALALSPTPENLRHTVSTYSALARRGDSRRNSQEALVAARRFQELSWQWLHQSEPGSPHRKVLSDEPFELHVRFPIEGETDEVRGLRSETNQLSLKRWEALLGEARTQPARRLELLLQRLDHAASLALSGREFSETLPRLVDEIERTLGELGSTKSTSDARYASFCQLLVKAVTRSRLATQRGFRSTDLQQWELDEVTGLWTDLSKHDDPVVRVTGLSALTSVPGEEGERAAARILEGLQELPSFEHQGQSLFDGMVRAALERSPAAQADEFVEGLILATEQSRDASPLLRYVHTVTTLVNRAEPDQRQRWSERIVKALDSVAPSASSANSLPAVQRMVPRVGVGRWPPPATATQPPVPTYNPLTDLTAFRASIARHLASSRPESPPVFSVADGEGPWSEYAARPIEIKKSPENLTLRSVWVDRHPEAKQRGGELVLVWSRQGRQLSVERQPLDEGDALKFGPDFPGLPRPFRGIRVASSADAVFVASGAPGFVCLRPGSVETIDEEQGAPANEVYQLAWWKDRLFVAYRDALASYDPRSKKFTVIASSLTVEPRNPLDGQGSFFVSAMIPDEQNGCLWMHVQDNVIPHSRDGIWRFDPEKNQFAQITIERSSWSWSEGNIFVHMCPEVPRWALLNPQTSKLTILSDYRRWSVPPESRIVWPRVLKVGDHIITEFGQLYTPDGKVHQVKQGAAWEHFQPVGSGYITHFEPETNRLWYLERKTKPSEALGAGKTETEK